MAKNVRPNANIPPLRFELDNLRRAIAEHFSCSLRNAPKHQQYKNAVLAIKAYHRQAANMTLNEQRQFISLVTASNHVVSDFTVKYRTHNPDPTAVNKKRKLATPVNNPAAVNNVKSV
ncbi:hypothetical protein V8C44DRAFT_357184 [Trichoderma aethiopicum]